MPAHGIKQHFIPNNKTHRGYSAGAWDTLRYRGISGQQQQQQPRLGGSLSQDKEGGEAFVQRAALLVKYHRAFSSVGERVLYLYTAE